MSLAIRLTEIKAPLAVVSRNHAWRTIFVTMLQETMEYQKVTGVEHVRTLLGSPPSVSNAWPVSRLQCTNVPFNFYELANLALCRQRWIHVPMSYELFELVLLQYRAEQYL
jgi:hypothetical protein